MRNRASEVFLVAALAMSVGNVAAGPYTFTNIADSSGPFDGLGSPSLNNGGTVAFSALLDTDEGGIFIGSGGPTTTIVDSTGPIRPLSAPSLNDGGTVSFYALQATGGSGHCQVHHDCAAMSA